MPDAAPASHAGNSCTDKITHPFYRLNLLPIPSYHSPRKGARPLCYFLGEKVTQKHFHTAAPLGRQYESAFARSRGGSPELPAAAVSRRSRPAPQGAVVASSQVWCLRICLSFSHSKGSAGAFLHWLTTTSPEISPPET